MSALRVVVVAFLALALVFWNSPLRAATPELRARVDREVVEVGDIIHYSLDASSESDSPQDPDPGAIRGFEIRGRSSMPSSQLSIINGVRRSRIGLTTTWTLRAARLGTFTFGPASVSLNGKRWKAQPVQVHVVSKGQAPPQSPSANDPFGSPFSVLDPWKGLLPDVDRRDSLDTAQRATADPALSLDEPRGRLVFLHATVDKKSAVVGEQVTFNLYLYVERDGGEPAFLDQHEATTKDFLRKSLIDDRADDRPLGTALVDGKLWNVRLVRRWALFPLRTGDLDIGPMSLTVGRTRWGAGGPRESESFRVHVTEPPTKDRPPGYTLGDVGQFEMTATLEPRQLNVGAAASVTVELSGTGNIPGTLRVPVRPGIRWMDPEIKDTLGAKEPEKFGGRRRFNYVVRFEQPGIIDVGEIVLPFWNPDTKTYSIARAPLGTVTVSGTAPSSSSDPLTEVLPNLPAPNASRSPTVRTYYYADRPIFYAMSALPPVLTAFAIAATAAARRYRARRNERWISPAEKLRRAIKEAQTASTGQDGRALDAATVRAIEVATVAKCDVHVRDAAGNEVIDRLKNKGVGDAQARAIANVIREAEAARFSPEGASIEHARKRWNEARQLIDALENAA